MEENAARSEDDNAKEDEEEDIAIPAIEIPQGAPHPCVQKHLIVSGFRGRPTALCAKSSRDNGKTWSEPAVLRRGSRNWDFGYSRSLQRADGNVITVYYWATPEHRNQHIAATLWNPSDVR